MIIESIELKDFRNYEELLLHLDKGINILYGDNAQGKTNVLEALYVGCTSKSHKSVKDRELIRFSMEEAHLKLNLLKRDVPYRIDMHIKKNKSKGIALNGVPIRRASQLFGIANVVFFSPEDLYIIKNGPSERRKFMDMELCQLDKLYVHHLISYNRVLSQRNKLLKELVPETEGMTMLEIYDEQLEKYGVELIRIREGFIRKLNEVVQEIHERLTDGRERLTVVYMEAETGDTPLLLLDDVLSELDRTRQNMLLSSIKNIQAVITCTGLDDFINNRFHIDKIFKVQNGTVTGEN